MPTKNGQKGPHLQPTNYGLTESGRFATWTWQGERSVIQQLIPGIEALGGVWTLQESFTGGADTIVARFATIPGEVETPVNEWELFASKSEKDLLHYDCAAINSLTDEKKRDIESALDDPSHSPEFNDDNAQEIYSLMLSGFRAAVVGAPILRHTQTVTRNWQIPASLTNVKSIYSTGSLIDVEGIPGDILFQLPLEISSKDGFVFGWYKDYPTVRTAARRRSQIEQEWQYGLWPVRIFGSAL
jgi:hypothetical protein